MNTPEVLVQAETGSLSRHAMKRGGLLSLVAIMLIAVAYGMNYKIIASFKFIGPFLGLCVAVAVVTGMQYRNQNGGLSYGDAFKHGFIVLLTYGVVSTLFNMLLYNVIDLELGAKVAEEMTQNFGATQSADQFTPIGLILNLAKMVPAYGIISLVTAIFVRKNKPVQA